MTKNNLSLSFAFFSTTTHHEVTCILHHNSVYIGFDNGMIIQDKEFLLLAHTSPVSALHANTLPDFSSHRNEQVLFSGSHDGELLLWANDGNLLRRSIVYNHIIKCISATPEHILVGGYYHEIILLNYSLQPIKTIVTQDWPLQFIPNGYISFHGTSYTIDGQVIQHYGRDKAIATNESLLIGKKYLTRQDTHHSIEMNDLLGATHHNNQVIAWTVFHLFILSPELQVLSSVPLPAIFGGFVNNNFHAVLRDRMVFLTVHLDTMDIIEEPLWPQQPDPVTAFEYASPNTILYGINGVLHTTTVQDLFTSKSSQQVTAHTDKITCIFVIQDTIITGGSDHMVKFWDKSLQLLSQTTLSAEIIQFLLPTSDFTELKNCFFCTTQDYSLYIINFIDYKVKYLFSGMAYPITEIGWRSKESLLLIHCRDNSTYCWSLQTSHLDRIITTEKLNCDAHFNISWKKDLRQLHAKVCAIPISTSADHKLISHVLMINSKQLIHECHVGFQQSKMGTRSFVNMTTWDHKCMDYHTIYEMMLGILAVLVPRNDKLFDMMASFQLPTSQIQMTVGLCGMDNALGLVLPHQDGWHVSGFLCGAKLMVIGTILKLVDFCKGSSAFDSIMTVLLEQYQGCMPSLDFLLRFYNDSETEIKHTSRYLFHYFTRQMPEMERMAQINEKLEYVKHLLKHPSSQISKASARSLFLLGILYSEFELTMDIRMLCQCILQILTSDQVSGKIAMAELFLSHYDFWKRYLDPNAMLDGLFHMLAYSIKDDEEMQSQIAEKTLLHICFVDPQQFMARVQYALEKEELREKLAILKLLLTGISKDALFMQPLVPEICFLIVKLLDPATPAIREGLNDIIKNLLLCLVSRYPNVSFNSYSNRLAVGTDSGRIVVYDVSSGTKAFVLQQEGACSAVAFKQDGSCLVSYSFGYAMLNCYKPSLPGLGILGTLIGTMASAAFDTKRREDQVSIVQPSRSYEVPIHLPKDKYCTMKQKHLDLIHSVKLEWANDAIHLHSLGDSKFSFPAP